MQTLKLTNMNAGLGNLNPDVGSMEFNIQGIQRPLPGNLMTPEDRQIYNGGEIQKKTTTSEETDRENRVRRELSQLLRAKIIIQRSELKDSLPQAPTICVPTRFVRRAQIKNITFMNHKF